MERLIEYLIVVGSTNPHLDVTVPPELLRKFPKEDHDDFPLPIDVVFFCQPEGCPTASKRLSLRETNSFVFTLTEKDSGIVRYGVCCNFFRPSYGQKDPSNQEGSNFGDSSVEESPGSSSFVSSDDSRNERRHARVASCRTLTSICIISRYPFISTFRECLFVLRRLIESRSQAYSLSNLAHDWNVVTDKERHRMKYVPNPVTRNWAMFLNPECYDDIKHPLTKEINEIELWIEKLLNIPLPMAGCHRIEVELLPRHVQPPLTFALPEKSRFSLLDFPLHLPLELLGVETCLKVLTCILLEYKVSHFLLDVRNCNIEVHIVAGAQAIYHLQLQYNFRNYCIAMGWKSCKLATLCANKICRYKYCQNIQSFQFFCNFSVFVALPCNTCYKQKFVCATAMQ